MKFRFVLLGPDDDPNERTPPSKDSGNPGSSISRLVRYERSDLGMLHIERSQEGRARVTLISNFNARIVGDLIVDDSCERAAEIQD